jgi:biopolymer transport protein TolQ
MMHEQSILTYFYTASPVVQVVIGILLIASVISWAIIIQKWFYLGHVSAVLKRFEKRFWNAESLDSLHQELDQNTKKQQGLAVMFFDAYKVFKNIASKPIAAGSGALESVRRILSAHLNYEEEALSGGLSFLATIGSVSPYVGLFGTVWGIMNSFQALGSASQVTIAMVAPGIAEALVATAVGLFAAIPAVIFYNRYVNKVDRLLNRYEAFNDQLLSRLQCKAADAGQTTDA